MDVSLVVTLAGSFMAPCCALSFWPRETWEFVRRDLEIGKPTLALLLTMSAIGSVLTWWLPRLPPLPPKPRRSCARCESLVALTPLGPEPPCPHPPALVQLVEFDDGVTFHECQNCTAEVELVRPQTQAEADELLEKGPRWRAVSQTARAATD